MMTVTSGHAARNGEKSLGHSIPLEGERYVLESEIRECFGRCAYTHKTHAKMAERNARGLRRVTWVQVVLSELTTGGAVAVISEEPREGNECVSTGRSLGAQC